MGNLRNPLGAAALDEYVNYIMTHINPGTAPVLVSKIQNMDNNDSSVAFQERMKQVRWAVMQNNLLTNGQIVSVNITAPGTGYSVGDKATITSLTGYGASLVISEVGGSGEIVAVEVVSPGEQYSEINVPTADFPDSAGVDGAITLSVDNKVEKVSVAFDIILNPS